MKAKVTFNQAKSGKGLGTGKKFGAKMVPQPRFGSTYASGSKTKSSSTGKGKMC